MTIRAKPSGNFYMATFNNHTDRMIKVCGMRDARSIREVSALTPMMMGFIFYEGSPRSAIGLDPALVRELPPFITPVGVFVDESEDKILDTCRAYGIDTVQLHGSESPDLCASLRMKGLYVLKAVSVDTDTDWASLHSYDGCVEMFVLDTKCTTHGGSGRKFDWGLLERWPLRTPYLLSGGIGPEDLDSVIAAMRPHMAGIDLNSRFETSPGNKDAVRLASFIVQLRNFNEPENEPTTIPFWKKK